MNTRTEPLPPHRRDKRTNQNRAAPRPDSQARGTPLSRTGRAPCPRSCPPRAPMRRGLFCKKSHGSPPKVFLHSRKNRHLPGNNSTAFAPMRSTATPPNALPVRIMQSVIATKNLETEPSQKPLSRLPLLFPDAFRPVSIVNNAGRKQDTCHRSQNTRYAIPSLPKASLKKTEKIARGILPIPSSVLHISLRQTAGVTDR